MDEEYQQELQERAEYGRKAKITSEFLKDFLLEQRAAVIFKLESNEPMTADEALEYRRWLRLFSEFNNRAHSYIQLGEMAEEELKDDVS